MKKSLIFSSAVALLSLASCRTEQTSPSFSTSCEYTFEIASTKALIGESCIEWEEGDFVGTFAGGLNNNAGAITLGTPCTFTVKSQSALAEGAKIYAYYPYSEAAGSDPKAVSLSIPSAQTINAAGFDADAMPMAAEPYTVTGSIEPGTDTPVGGIHFRNLGSIIRFNLYSNGTVAAGDKIQSVKFIADKNICGSYTSDLTAEEASLAEVAGGKIVESIFAEPAEVPGSKEEAVVCEMVVAPGTFGGTVIVTTDNASYAKTVAEKTYERNALKPLSLDISTMTDITVRFDVEGVQNFNKGESTDYNLTVSDALTDLSVKSAPEGWTASLNGKTLTVTAPADDSKALEGDVVLQGLGLEVGVLQVRLYGINSKADLLAFQKAHGSTDNEYKALDAADEAAHAAAMAPYLVEGELSLNADVTIGQEDLATTPAYFMHHLYVPINGNNHRMTFNFEVTKYGFCGPFQHLHGGVKNLKISGELVGSYSGALTMTGFAQQNYECNAVISNVVSDIKLTLAAKAGTESKIAGILNFAANNKTLELSGCKYSGEMTVNSSVFQAGGLMSYGTADGKGTTPGKVTVKDCTFDGKMTFAYASLRPNTRIGGIMGSQERDGELTGCINSGTITFNMDVKPYSSANTFGIGGIVGRCNAKADGYTMHTVVKNCSFLGDIVFNATHPSQSTEFINKIIGTPLDGYDNEASTGNVETGKISYNYPTADAYFNDPSAVTFDFNKTEEFDITTKDAVNLTVKSAPEGWTVDLTNWKSGKISVTAPDIETENPVRAGFIVLEVEAAGGVKFSSSNSKRVRMQGIYDVQDMIDFRAAYGCDTDLHTSGKPVNDISAYMIDDEIAITGDIIMPAEALYKGNGSAAPYWMVTLVKPLNGNGHTLTVNTSHATRGALIQDLMADVHDLKIAGKMTCNGAAAYMGGLCCFISNDNITISNVESAVTMEYSGSDKSYIGGLVAGQRKYGSTATKYTMNGCSFTGKIISTTAGLAIGGIVGCGQIGMKGHLTSCVCDGTISVNGGLMQAVGGIYGASGSATNPGEVVYLTGCSFGGTINYKNSVATGNCRIGGIIGDLARGAELTGCVNDGEINVDMNKLAFTSSTARGIGGIVGRTTAPATQYPNLNAYSKLVDNTFSGKITVTNSVDTEDQNAAGIDKIVGRKINTKTAEESGSVENGIVSISYVE